MTISVQPGAEAPAPHSAEPPARRPSVITGWVAGALLLGLLLGLGAGYFLPVLSRPADDSVEAGFLRDMSTHHGQAVDMALIIRATTDDTDLAELSSDITVTQQGQVGMMQSWLREWKLGSTGTQPAMAWMPGSDGALQNGLMPGMASQEQMEALRTATGKEQEVMFLTLMRQHHLGGIHMAQKILELSDDENTTWLARSIVASQQTEITAIQSLLARLQQG